MSWKQWTRTDTDNGGVLWAILCCWLAVFGNLLLLAGGVSVSLVVPWSLFGVPLAATMLLWLVGRRRG